MRLHFAHNRASQAIRIVLCIVDIYICAYPNFIVVRYLLFVAAITVCCMIYCLFHDVNLRLRWSDTHCNPAYVITGILL